QAGLASHCRLRKFMQSPVSLMQWPLSAAMGGGRGRFSPPRFLGGGRQLVVALRLKNQLPLFFLLPDFDEAGGLCRTGPNLQDLFWQAAAVTRKLLLRARAADLPVERPARFQLAINLKTAKALSLTIPPSLLARADEVIE